MSPLGVYPPKPRLAKSPWTGSSDRTCEETVSTAGLLTSAASVAVASGVVVDAAASAAHLALADDSNGPLRERGGASVVKG